MALEKKISDFQNALERLNEAFVKTKEHQNEEEYSFFRDSTIQRFEFTLEIAWKSIKTFLLEQDGIECRSPKACMRDFFSTGYIDEVGIGELLAMIDDRNLATHTYHEALADEIFEHISVYLVILQNIYNTIHTIATSDK
ncbi:HI0074 family nucleotidyltransferase substrate-binding subunit [Sulfurovum riftiae]|uniref:Nucleotidyltransferase n=1 Tax=Sulfurovum riftiae TaxID=1630136 RepID=A0A151CDQ8_9BACT|nr:HI0074 family nucleotidyltransferase substrate-binding subunit [Sulfurovum riftiae]KYJ85657.1 nucleotidyltransferase [Sulfurovum riftiae]